MQCIKLLNNSITKILDAESVKNGQIEMESLLQEFLF